MTQYHHTFGLTSSPRFRVLQAISELGEPTKSQIEDYLRDNPVKDRKVLSSDIKGITTKGLRDLLGTGYIVEVDDTYRITEEGARVMYEV